MSFAQVLAPAIGVASKALGECQLQPPDRREPQQVQALPATAALYMKDGKALPAGTLLRNPIWPRLTANWPAAASRLL
jgi:gamma-glutamyltranspeptidase/glutathione hydrolase